MSRADMFINPRREAWMTPALEGKLKTLAQEGRISCSQVQKFAQDNGIELHRMKSFVDVAGVKVVACQLGCF